MSDYHGDAKKEADNLPPVRTTPTFDDAFITSAAQRRVVSKRELAAQVRRHAKSNLYDETGLAGRVALYALADPRDIRDVRYIGQTRTPTARFLQHINTARLWLTDDVPWWIKTPQMRPLYVWIRDLYAQEERLPVMVISAWAGSVKEARLAERARIMQCLQEGYDLYNVEKELLHRQLPLV